MQAKPALALYRLINVTYIPHTRLPTQPQAPKICIICTVLMRNYVFSTYYIIFIKSPLREINPI